MPSPPPSPFGYAAPIVEQALHAALIAGGSQPGIFGISGLQGSGKSTLAGQIVDLASTRGIRAVSLSIDDFYLSRAERQTLARDAHPLLATRGPPGTHDVGLALHTLDSLRRGEHVALPRFDKLADDRWPESRWPKASAPELIVFEGWFLGTPAETEAALVTPLNRLERDEDRDGRWRHWCNRALARDYPTLWQRIDTLWFLQPPGFEVVADWRWQQEQALQAAKPQRAAMDRTGVERFIQYFERVSRQALRALPAVADYTLILDAHRQPLTAGFTAPQR